MATRTANGHASPNLDPNPAVRVAAGPDTAAESVAAYERSIANLNAALAAAAAARLALDDLDRQIERIEASAVLRVEGPNEAARRARLTLELADDDRYTRALAEHRRHRAALFDAERWTQVEREACRLLRAALALIAAA